MKKFLKIFLIILLVAILGLEIYFYIFKNKDSTSEIITNNTEKESEEKIETKYLANIFTGYNNDNLTYNDVKESEQVYYKTISGLKNKAIEEKVNNKIKEKIDSLKKDKSSDYIILNNIASNFENTLSVGFCAYEKKDYISSECGAWSYIDGLNFDLNTGKEIKITDIVNVKSSIKSHLLNKTYEDFSKMKGIICEGGPCENPNPDYSKVEDEQFQVVNKFNKDKYSFVFTPTTLSLIFKNLDILNPQMCNDNEAGSYKVKPSGTEYEISIKDYHEKEYTASIDLLNLLDNLTIYDKFKSNDNIYEKDGSLVDMKFVISNNPYTLLDKHMIEVENGLVDYDLGPVGYLDGNLKDKIYPNAKNSVIKESSSLKTDKYNIYDMFGYTDMLSMKYQYVSYDVKHYSLEKDIYGKNKKQIYLDKYKKAKETEEGLVEYTTYDDKQLGYSYLKDYKDKDAFYYYIYDTNGNQVSTTNIVNHDYLSSLIPDEWLNLGNYKTKEDMIKNALTILNSNRNYSNYLVIHMNDNEKISLKYKGKEIYLAGNYTEYNECVNKLFK